MSVITCSRCRRKVAVVASERLSMRLPSLHGPAAAPLTQPTGPCPSCRLCSAFERDQERLLDALAHPAQETGGFRTIDEPVVVGEGEWQHEPRGELPGRPVVNLLHGAAGDPEDRDLRRGHYRGEARTADATQVTDAEVAALHLVRGQLALTRLLCQFSEFHGQLDQVF